MSASKFTFQSKNKDLKSYLSNEIRLNCGSRKRGLFQYDNYETKSSKLAVETLVSLKWRTVVRCILR